TVAATTAPTLPVNTSVTASTTSTMQATASANSTTRRNEPRRASSCCSKKFIGTYPWSTSGASRRRTLTMPPRTCRPREGAPRAARSELDPRRLAHLRGPVGRRFQQRRRGEVEHAGHHAGREHLAPVDVGHHRVGVGLAREGDAILGRGQLLGQLHHVLF